MARNPSSRKSAGFYNSPQAYNKKRERSKRRKAYDQGNPSSEYLGADIKFILRKYADDGTVSYQVGSPSLGALILNYPVAFTSKEFSGVIDFGLGMTISVDPERKD